MFFLSGTFKSCLEFARRVRETVLCLQDAAQETGGHDAEQVGEERAEHGEE